MDYFNERSGRLYAEEIPLTTIAETYGTPLYVYSRATLERHYRAFDHAFGETQHLICYAVKANSNLAVLNVLARLGSGFDIVSKGELERVLRAGGDPSRVVFSGVGKQEDELRYALEVGIRCFNVEVPDELDILNRLAGELGVRRPSPFGSILTSMQTLTPTFQQDFARINSVFRWMLHLGSTLGRKRYRI